MCKVMAMAGIKPNKTKQAWEFIKASVPYMSENDKDGLGYAASFNGEIFGERWLSNSKAFKQRQKLSLIDMRLKGTLKQAVNLKESYNSFGNLKHADKMQSIILHTRMATCGISIENTHPFVSGNTALIHNGVISNTRELTNLTSTCDSECILNEYVSNNVADNPNTIQSVADKIKGYYACAVLSKVNDEPYLDIFKCDRAKLVIGYVKELDTFVFCTNSNILVKTARAAKMRVESIHEVESGKLIRLNTITGKSIDVVDFDYTASQYKYNEKFESWRNRNNPIEVIESEAIEKKDISEKSIEELIEDRFESPYHLKFGL